MNDLNAMTRKQFEALPEREAWDEETPDVRCIVVLPTRRLHDSGYRALDFVLVSPDKMVRIGGCSDVIHVDGIGGYGPRDEKRRLLPNLVPPSGWSVDCLKCGLLRFFCNSGRITAGVALSSFEIWAQPKTGGTK